MAVKYSHTNVHSWLSFLGLSQGIAAASLTLFAGLGVWTYVYRRCDVWLLAGVAALVARFWTYHGWYDDLLVVLPLISLFRVAKSGGSRKGDDWLAGVLFAVTLLTLMAPGGLYLFPRPWNQVYVAGQTVVWAAVLVFLSSLVTSHEVEKSQAHVGVSGSESKIQDRCVQPEPSG